MNQFKVGGDQDCPICGWDAQTIYTNVHQKRCKAWQRACKTLEYSPMFRLTAEEIIGSTKTQLSSNGQEDVDVSMDLVRALYDRSLGQSIDNDNALEHPQFTEYVSMLDLPEIGPTLRGRYPLESGQIAPGFTIWEPPGSKDRRMQFRKAQQQSRSF
jgi:hypothetical protein